MMKKKLLVRSIFMEQALSVNEGVSKQAHPLIFMRKAQTFASPGFVIS